VLFTIEFEKTPLVDWYVKTGGFWQQF
jgi:hypothetical protein